MASVNKVILVGNLGQDPTVRYTAAGEAFASLSLATTDSWKDKATGEKKELTEWHRLTCFGKLAEICGQYLKKGSQIYVEGSLRTRKWQDKDGSDRYTTEVRIDEMKMLGSRPAGGQREASDYAPPPAGNPPSRQGGRPNFDDIGDDIPFSSATPRGPLGHVCHD